MWSACSGPTLGAVVIGLAAQSETAGRAAMVMAMFSLGAATPILAHRLRLAVGRASSTRVVNWRSCFVKRAWIGFDCAARNA